MALEVLTLAGEEDIMRHKMISLPLIVAFAAAQVFAQAAPAGPRPESHKYRTVLTIAGAGGGFGLGVVIGLSAFDDAKYADRKIWTTSLLSAAAGGVAGYFIGRAIDKSRSPGGKSPAAMPRTAVSLERTLVLQEAARRVTLQPSQQNGPEHVVLRPLY